MSQTPCAVELQPLVKDVGLERVVDRRQRGDEGPQAVEIRGVRRRVVPPVHIDGRTQLGQIDVDELGLREQVRLALDHLIELAKQQLAVDVQRAEGGGVALGGAIGQNERDQVGVIGARQTRQKLMHTLLGEGLGVADEPVERGVLKAAQGIGVVRHGPLHERVAGDELGVQRRGQGLLTFDGFLFVVEVEVEFVLDEAQGALGIGVVDQQRLAVLDLGDAAVAPPMLLDPRRQQFIDLAELLLVLQVQAVVVVIIRRPGNELLERHATVGSQSEVLLEAQLAGPGGRGERGHRGQGQRQGDGECGAFHERFPYRRDVGTIPPGRTDGAAHHDTDNFTLRCAEAKNDPGIPQETASIETRSPATRCRTIVCYAVNAKATA